MVYILRRRRRRRRCVERLGLLVRIGVDNHSLCRVLAEGMLVVKIAAYCKASERFANTKC
jgi:hypothetical protein